jgi:hypothetical protein
VSAAVAALAARERTAGVETGAYYDAFAEQVRETKRKLLEFLIAARRAGKTVVGYGAAAKGNTLLNYCGVRADFLDYVVDKSPHKQGRFLPGTPPILRRSAAPKPAPTTCSSCPGTSRRGDRRRLAGGARWGGRVRGGDPRDRGAQ